MCAPNQITRRHAPLLCRLFFVVALVLAGCGGGTTGTSSTGGFQLVGVTEDAKRAPIPLTSMNVLSGSSNEVLLASQTDSTGRFSMELPGDETSLIVDIQGTRSATLVRTLPGQSIVSTKLAQASSGAVSFSETFEVQIDTNQLCPALETENNQLFQNAEPLPSECPVTLLVKTNGTPISALRGLVRSGCNVRIAESKVGNSGVITLDLAPVLSSQCGSIEIIVSRVNSPLQSAVFPVFTTR
jgi:hypothetical protein